MGNASPIPGVDYPCTFDETYVGGTEEGKRGRAIEKKSIVVIAAEKNGLAIGRIRLKRAKAVSAESLLDFIRETVEPGATPTCHKPFNPAL